MAPASSSSSSLSFLPTCCLCLVGVLLLGGGHGSTTVPSPMAAAAAAAEPPQAGSRGGCEFDRLRPLEPLPQKLVSEGGTVELFDETDRQLRCAGAFVIRLVVDPSGLVLPRYANDAALAFAHKGSGFVGFTFPGCSEVYYRFRQGDIIALPPGVPFWIYNDGDAETELIFMFNYVNNDVDQIESRHKEFVLAGANSSRSNRSDSMGVPGGGVGGQNILSGFAGELLAESLGLDERLAGSLRGDGERASNIVRAPHIRLRPSPMPRQEPMLCRMTTSGQVVMNLDDHPADPRSRSITRLTARNFPVLASLGLSAERGTLDKGTVVSPHYVINAQSVVVVLRGSARLQVVDNVGAAVFDGELRRGQLLVIPRLFVILTKAGSAAGVDYVVFKTDADPRISNVAGPGSYLRGLPAAVIAAAYNVPAGDAVKIKNSGTNQEPL